MIFCSKSTVFSKSHFLTLESLLSSGLIVLSSCCRVYNELEVSVRTRKKQLFCSRNCAISVFDLRISVTWTFSHVFLYFQSDRSVIFWLVERIFFGENHLFYSLLFSRSFALNTLAPMFSISGCPVLLCDSGLVGVPSSMWFGLLSKFISTLAWVAILPVYHTGSNTFWLKIKEALKIRSRCPPMLRRHRKQTFPFWNKLDKLESVASGHFSSVQYFQYFGHENTDISVPK